jgi:Ran GTPase-activating protein (RanGAP) involved in mRNA processing and transport
MKRSLASVATAALAVLCFLFCNSTPVSSNASADEDADCSAIIASDEARTFLRSRAMQNRAVLICEEIEHLNLGGGEFRGRELEVLVPSLLRMRALKTLDLSHMSIGPDEVNALAPVFATLNNLQRLSFNGNPIGRSGAALLANSISSNSIEWLQLEHADIGPEGLVLLKPLLLRQNSTLTWLNLENCGLGPQGAASVAEVIGSFQQLHELNIARNDVGDSGGSALLAQLPWHTLRKLWLGSNALTGASLQHIQGRSIQLLDLSANSLAPNCSRALAAVLYRMRDLHTLLLGGNSQLADEGVLVVADSFDSLPSLSYVALDGLYLSQEASKFVTGKMLQLKIQFSV